MTDVTHLSLTQEQRFEWQTVLDIEDIAQLIIQYFGTNKQGDHGDHTLSELFAKVPFHYSLNSDEEELSTYMAYKDLVSNYERARRLNPTQHVELVTTLEKRLARGVVVPGIPDLRAVPDLVTIHSILPPTVHLHPRTLLASCSRLIEVNLASSIACN